MAGVVTVEEQVGTVDAADPRAASEARDALAASTARDEAVVDNVARHLRAHPDARVRDDRGRPRPLTAQEADNLARVTLRAVAPWLAPVTGPAADDAVALRVVSARAARAR